MQDPAQQLEEARLVGEHGTRKTEHRSMSDESESVVTMDDDGEETPRRKSKAKQCSWQAMDGKRTRLPTYLP